MALKVRIHGLVREPVIIISEICRNSLTIRLQWKTGGSFSGEIIGDRSFEICTGECLHISRTGSGGILLTATNASGSKLGAFRWRPIGSDMIGERTMFDDGDPLPEVVGDFSLLENCSVV